MTQEIKDKLEQAAETAWEQDQKTNPYPVNPHAYVYGYKAGAQTILDAPGEWGLETTKEALTGRNRILSLQLKNTELQSQLTEYREALEHLERFTSDNPDYEFINHRLKEVLKQQ